MKRADLYKQVLNSKEGKELVLDLLEFCGFGANKPTDTNDIIRAAGREDVALFLLRQLRSENLKAADVLDKDFINTVF